jgi:hypothetical protein
MLSHPPSRTTGGGAVIYTGSVGWIGCIAGELGTNGNIAADPLFCHTDVGSLAIANDSPCAPAQSACGLIGAVGPECATLVAPATWGSIKAAFGGNRPKR